MMVVIALLSAIGVVTSGDLLPEVQIKDLIVSIQCWYLHVLMDVIVENQAPLLSSVQQSFLKGGTAS